MPTTVCSPNNTGAKPKDKPLPDATKPLSPGARCNPGNASKPDSKK